MTSRTTIAAPIGRLNASAASPAEQQDAQDLLGGVGDRGERVRGEDGQRLDLGQPLVRAPRPSSAARRSAPA